MEQSDFDLAYQNKHTSGKIVASLERIAQAFRVLLWQESKSHALSPIQVQLLIFLLHHNEHQRGVSYLADEFNMTKATISDAIKTLEQKGLVVKEKTLHDSRSAVISLTQKGKDVAKQTALFSKEIRYPIEQLSVTEQELLLQQLLGVISQLNQSGIITIQRMCSTCKYYRSTPKTPHFCELLNSKLHPAELRLDCPEHKLAHS